MATTKKPETTDAVVDGLEDTTTTETKERKPRMSRLERLKKELAEAKAKEIERVQKKHAGIKAKLENKLVQLAKIQVEINELQAELVQARNEMPIVTDGIGEPDETVKVSEPETDETGETNGVGEPEIDGEADEDEDPAEA